MLTTICELTSSSQPTVKKVLSNIGIDYDLERKDQYQKKLDQVLILYRQGKSQLFIEQELGLTRKTIRELIKTTDLDYRDKSDQAHIRYETKIDHNAFDELTPEVLYWIGMLYSDGHITEKENSIELTLHNNDIEHLEKFKEFLKSDRDIKPGNGDCSRVRVNSKRIKDRLIELGFIHNKSTSIIPHEKLKYSKDFWRGVVDGDGGVYNYSKNKGTDSVFLCGTLATMFDFITFCSKELGIKDKYPIECPGKNLFSIQYYGKSAAKVATLLYKDSTIFLERKYNEYINITS